MTDADAGSRTGRRVTVALEHVAAKGRLEQPCGVADTFSMYLLCT